MLIDEVLENAQVHAGRARVLLSSISLFPRKQFGT